VLHCLTIVPRADILLVQLQLWILLVIAMHDCVSDDVSPSPITFLLRLRQSCVRCDVDPRSEVASLVACASWG